MEPKFAVKMSYDENLFYHQVLASKPRMAAPETGRRTGPAIRLSDVGIAAEGDRMRAKALLDSSGLAGKPCTVVFAEDSFTVESPGIITEYKYEGIAWVKETPEYYMIFWNQSLAIPVEKAGFYRGKKEQFQAFLEKKCGKAVEKVSAA